ncbi:MAG: lipopolysaccharide biosynthesis protein [Roseburia sp.]|nr:lipopolysaccharide biosynthesis protein [Roseburia sp.]
MSKKITGKKFAQNVAISLAVQIVSLIVSFVLQLIVPKFIDKGQYAYWQTYVLYVGYVGVLHFGLLDGLVLRYSKYDYEELDKARLRSQFQILLIFTSAITLITALVSAFALGGVYRYIVIFVAVGIITKNVVTYSSYMLQITNRIGKYAILIIAQKVVYGLIVVVLLALHVNDFKFYCLADLCGDAAAIVIGLFFNRGLYFGKPIAPKPAFKELKINVASGIILMMANWSSMLMIGGAKMIVQWRWDELLFSDVSFAFAVSNVFLVFVTAISVVLFPSLKRLDEDKLPQMYKNIRNIISPFLFIVMIFYFAGCWVLKRWLPAYAVSLKYLGILLPLIIFSSKVSLLTNNYLKVYRKEKLMLLANVISIALGAALFVLCAYVFNSVYALLACVVFVIMFNSVLSEIFVMKTIRVKFVKDFIIEALTTVAFILCASLLNLWQGCLAYLGVIAVYCAVNYKSIAEMFKTLTRKKAPEAVEKAADKELSAESETEPQTVPYEQTVPSEQGEATENISAEEESDENS